MNSTPTAALRNTCAGITELHIFKLSVRVLVAKDEEGEGEHLELVFGKRRPENGPGYYHQSESGLWDDAFLR